MVQVLVVCALAACSSARPDTDPDATKLVISGVVTKIFPTAADETTLAWGVTVRVESVESGTYSQPEFSFRVHSPTLSGLVIGQRYTIVATRSKGGYTVDDSQWVKRSEDK
jgi:hypothetical protein